jgi:uncharacterized repeat protein (TIGR03837 family)
LPSPHPRFTLIKTCFFPGFVQGTGGLLREKNLMAQREAFNIAAEQEFLCGKNLSERKSAEIRISLFCYDTAPINQLIQTLSESLVPVLLIVPEGIVAERILSLLNNLPTERSIKHQQLTVQIIPFMEQTEYDRLLWSCDINFVRGEDSFVRAQWAINPFIWNIYPQADNVHWKKLDAFLDLYTIELPQKMAIAVREMWTEWNSGGKLRSNVWMNFCAFREPLALHNKKWAERLSKQDDLTFKLVQFVENRL